jgi:acetyltransferase-like isoleucine patch superfamily enzyme
MTTDPRPAPSGLPRSMRSYLRSPVETWHIARDWLVARVQLRSATEVGRFVRVEGHLHLENMGHLYIGDRVRFRAHYAPSVVVVFPGGTLRIGDRVFLNYGLDLSATALVEIGDDCMIGIHVMILDSDFHGITNRDDVPESKPVRIGERVWLGNRCIILPGVSIGDDSVVGAGSVVTSSVPARTVVAGNPARVVREF